MTNLFSEYHLFPDNELHMPNEALWVEGVGFLGQYHSYLDTLWEKGLPYFVRDYYFNELQTKLEEGVTSKSLRLLVNKINMLNSKILAYEKSCQQQVCPSS